MQFRLTCKDVKDIMFIAVCGDYGYTISWYHKIDLLLAVAWAVGFYSKTKELGRVEV